MGIDDPLRQGLAATYWQFSVIFIIHDRLNESRYQQNNTFSKIFSYRYWKNPNKYIIFEKNIPIIFVNIAHPYFHT